MAAKNRKFFLIAAIGVAALGAATLLMLDKFIKETKIEIETPKIEEPVPESPAPVTMETPGPRQAIIGFSVQGRQIEAYTFGGGVKELLFVGGMHGGYEWNSILLAYEFIDYLQQNPDAVSENLTVTVIPDANPDGVYKIVGKEGRFIAAEVPAGTSGDGRFNARGVDLNRNFDCNWRPDGVWQNKTVSGGSSAFSEPEAAAIRDYALAYRPAAVIFWHSKSGTVYGSGCNADMLDETGDIMNAYAKAAGYKTAPTFDSYAVNGDASDWLASIGIPAITAELATHSSIEWDNNLAGIKAVLKYYESKD